MKIIRIINNNVVVIIENKKEVILCGKGIGFQKKFGDLVDESNIEKVFRMDIETNKQFQEIIKNIPMEHIDIVTDIISEAKSSLGRRLNDTIYINLVDHISTAIQRAKDGIIIRNALYHEIKKFYPEEFAIGKMAIKKIKDKLGIELADDEIIFIALHFVGAEMDADVETDKMIEAMTEIVNFIRRIYGIEMNEDDVFYYRFITHLKFFVARLFTGQVYENVPDDGLLEIITNRYQDAFSCVEKISSFIFNKYGYRVSDEEKVYLTIHIARIVSKSRNDENS